jgi:signal transduction histidine kinase
MSKTLRMVIEELKAANEQLEKDIKEKELIDERRREFVSNVSHELKTPIALIQGYAEGLKEGISDDPESRDYYCGVIIDESAKMNTIVHRLLNLGEIESGIISLDRVDFNLTELLSNVVQSASMLCGGKKVDIRLDAPEELMVNADQMMIEEIMQNFISNACHHVSEPGEILITASKGEHAYVEVFNTGSHIPEEDLDRIWDKFFKVDRSHSRKYGGSGIGLSIVKAIAEAHGGSCGAVNKNDGVAFWFSL